MTQPFTVRDAIQRSSQWLQTRGLSTPRLDAELLLAHALDCKRLDLFMYPDRPLNEEETNAYREFIRRRAEHEPVAYILGTVGFWKHDFAIDRRALIPRPETEGILDVVLKAAGQQRDAALRIIDVGTGSGILAISLALEFPNAQVVAADISEEALALCEENATLLGVRQRVHPIRSDLLQSFIQRGSKADIIVSNPPYIGENERALMGEGVERWEPLQALFGGMDGFDLIDRLLAQVPQVLAPGGLFVMEFGSPQGDGIRARAQRLFRQWAVIQDYSQHDRLLHVDAPGERTWFEAAPTKRHEAADANTGDPLLEGADATNDPATEEEHVDSKDRAFLYGGADGTERLPEIDLRGDLNENE